MGLAVGLPLAFFTLLLIAIAIVICMLILRYTRLGFESPVAV